MVRAEIGLLCTSVLDHIQKKGVNLQILELSWMLFITSFSGANDLLRPIFNFAYAHHAYDMRTY
jgi:hypothetical protein